MLVTLPSVIITTCSKIPALGHKSSAGCTAVGVVCLFRIESAQKLIVPLFPVIKKLNMRGIFRHLCNPLPGHNYSNLVHPTLYCAFRSFICVSFSISIIQRVIETLSFVCFVMYEGYFLPVKTPKCSQFPSGIIRDITLSVWDGTQRWWDLVYIAALRLRFLHSNPVLPKILPSSGLGLADYSIGVRSMHNHLASRAGLPGTSASISRDSRVLGVKQVILDSLPLLVHAMLSNLICSSCCAMTPMI